MLSVAQRMLTSRGVSHAHKHALLAIFCLAQFIDAFSITALFSAIPSLVISLEMTAAESPWIISTFTLTFASFLLMVGAMQLVSMSSRIRCRKNCGVESVFPRQWTGTVQSRCRRRDKSMLKT